MQLKIVAALLLSNVFLSLPKESLAKLEGKKKKKLDAQGFDPRTSRMQSGRATKCTMHPSLIRRSVFF